MEHACPRPQMPQRTFRPCSLLEHAEAARLDHRAQTKATLTTTNLTSALGSSSLPDLRSIGVDMIPAPDPRDGYIRSTLSTSERPGSAGRARPSRTTPIGWAEEPAIPAMLIGEPSFLTAADSDDSAAEQDLNDGCDLQDELKTLRRTIRAARVDLHSQTAQARGIQAVLAEQRGVPMGSPRTQRREAGRWDTRVSIASVIASRVDSRLLQAISSHGSATTDCDDDEVDEQQVERDRHETAMRNLRGTIRGLSLTSDTLRSTQNRRIEDYSSLRTGTGQGLRTSGQLACSSTDPTKPATTEKRTRKKRGKPRQKRSKAGGAAAAGSKTIPSKAAADSKPRRSNAATSSLGNSFDRLTKLHKQCQSGNSATHRFRNFGVSTG